jgi:hypothetical protein
VNRSEVEALEFPVKIEYLKERLVDIGRLLEDLGKKEITERATGEKTKNQTDLMTLTRAKHATEKAIKDLKGNAYAEIDLYLDVMSEVWPMLKD